jgi:hypothetical protein
MSSKLETSFREILAPVISALGFEVMRQDWGGRCSELRLQNPSLELEVFHDVIDEASVRVRFLKEGDGSQRGYVDVLKEKLGSDFGLAEYLGGWDDRGFLPPNMPKVFAVLAETLPAITKKLASPNA